MKNKILIIMGALALLLSACTRKPHFPKHKDGNDYCRIVPWQYQGHDFAVELRFPVSTVEHYDSLPKDREYIDCVREDAQYPYALRVVQLLDSIAEPYGFTEKEMDEFTLSFVQAIGYQTDPGGYGYNRAPILTLLEGGDCVDLSCTYALLSSVRGQTSCLLVFPSEHHMAAGVELPGYTYSGYLSKSNHLYAFAETTAEGWELGHRSCRGDMVRIIEVPPVVTAWSRAHRHELPKCAELPLVTVTFPKNRKSRMSGK